MTASQKAKAAGLKNLDELVDISGESRQTLNNWHKKKPLKFELVLKGAVVKRLEGIK